MNIVNSRNQAPETWDDGGKPIDFTSYVDVLVRYRRTFLVVAGGVICAGLVYAMLAKPVYRADIVVQVEDSNAGAGAAGKQTANVTPVFDVKPAASAEIELLRSRMVVGKAIDSLRLDIKASPRYFPVVGQAIASYNKELSAPGLFGWGGFAWGQESISVPSLEVPPKLADRTIQLTALGGKQYRVSFASNDVKSTGTVGQPLTIDTPQGKVSMLVSELDGRPGSVFYVQQIPRAAAIEELQESLMILERGKQSGVIGMTLEGNSAEKTAAILNEIGAEYVEQNVRRKAAEAEKSLAFLDRQLPQLKQQVEAAESRYNAMRNQRGTIDLSEESKLILGQSVQIQTRLQDLKQKRQELIARFTSNHPTIEIMDSQIASLNAQLNGVTGKIQKLPDVEQNVLRLMRDVKVSTELYQSLLNDTQQLRLVKASKVGTARLVDAAEVPLKPVRPNRSMIAGVALVLGLLLGLLAVVVRRLLDGGVSDADEVEKSTGLTVYSTIPFSAQQARPEAARKASGKDGGRCDVLAHLEPGDPAIESLRSLRTALQFALAGSRSRVVVVTGPAPGVGKSFVCANFAAVLASGGKRVVLVDADLRRGSLNHRFGVARSPGLSEVLTGMPLNQAIRRQVMPGLDVIPTGTEPPHPADLLLGEELDTLLDTLKAQYDVVLIDTPPVLAASDAGILAAKAGAVFMVTRADQTTVGEITAANRAIQQAGGEIKGVLFNGLRIDGRWYRAHYHFGKYRYLNQYGTSRIKRA
ncbi:polysaccharide biosynthesis tyrosine autokinase [Cupriavidus sp.]|uniref:polysaccharide biosynthesis tyrosine autokinase n=1 Tax=Cupriavidus sp. TaxID=1873897 RepID=UPI003D110B78